jgi:hypothetical protein
MQQLMHSQGIPFMGVLGLSQTCHPSLLLPTLLCALWPGIRRLYVLPYRLPCHIPGRLNFGTPRLFEPASMKTMRFIAPLPPSPLVMLRQFSCPDQRLLPGVRRFG